MGNAQVNNRSRSTVSSENGLGVVKMKNVREHKRYGTVIVKINNMAPNRRPQDAIITHVITPKGTILFGSQCNPGTIQKALSTSGYPLLAPAEVGLPDSRAHKLLITYCNGWHAIPFPEVFSRHSGTCLILGDRNISSTPFSVKVGDCFRLGSVGLVVSELKTPDSDEVRLDAKTLQFLKDEALAFDTQEDMATLALDEENQPGRETEAEVPASPDRKASFDGSGLTNGERFICYMCYETHNTDEDALVAPCDCRGDTRYLHVQCLQKWYQSSVCGSQAQVIRTTGNGAPACKICGAAYKSAFRRADGKKASLLEVNSTGPYLSLVVVTKHDTNPGLFNTKFRLNFGRHANTPAHVSDEDANSVVIGRSSSCNMILDYRTVSTIHAKITYTNGQFMLTDKKSSNGTMVYLQDPLPLSYSTPLKFRMGRTTLSIQARRGWTSTLRSALGGGHVTESQSGPSATELHNLLVDERNSNMNKREAAQDNNNFLTQRSYTVKTLNDNSVDGGEADAEYLLALGNGPTDSPPRMRLASSGSALSNISESDQNGTRAVNDLTVPHRSPRSPRNSSGGSPRNSNRVRSRSNDSPNEGNSPRGSSRSHHHSSSHQTGSGRHVSSSAALRSTFVELDDDNEESDFQLAIQASLMAVNSGPTQTNSLNGGSSRQDTALQSPALSSRFNLQRTLSGNNRDRGLGGEGEEEQYYTLTNVAEDHARSNNQQQQIKKGSGIVSSSQRDYSVNYADEVSGDELEENKKFSASNNTNSDLSSNSRQGTIVLINSAIESGAYGSSGNSRGDSPAVLYPAGVTDLPAAGAFALPSSANRERRASGTVPDMSTSSPGGSSGAASSSKNAAAAAEAMGGDRGSAQYLLINLDTPKVAAGGRKSAISPTAAAGSAFLEV